MFGTNRFMQQALLAAEAAYVRGEVPVGAVIVDSKTQEILAIAGNRTEELNDPTAHAELLALRKACQSQGSPRLPECDLYVSLEPCPMCAQALAFARIRRIYFAASDPKGGGIEHGPQIFSSSSCHHKAEIYGGIQEREAALLLKRFFQERR
jgi:tRNA(Arg) A34 adenosine deaminase TadA